MKRSILHSDEVDYRPGSSTRRPRERGGRCSCCEFPISDRAHLIPFSQFGDLYSESDDVMDLCPNCHRCYHHYWNVVEFDWDSETVRWQDYVLVYWNYEPVLDVLRAVQHGNRMTKWKAGSISDRYTTLAEMYEKQSPKWKHFIVGANKYVNIFNECLKRESRLEWLIGQQIQRRTADGDAEYIERFGVTFMASEVTSE